MTKRRDDDRDYWILVVELTDEAGKRRSPELPNLECEPPRVVRRLQSLRRMESCLINGDRAATRWSCVNAR